MADRSERIVDGFYFEDGDILREARKEEEGVRYMKARIDLEQPDKVLHIYRRMLEQKSFQNLRKRSRGQAKRKTLRISVRII